MIREAKLTDIPWIMNLARSMWAESHYGYLAFSESKVRRVVHNTISSQSGITFVSENGFVFGVVCQHWASDDLVAIDFGMYVSPEKRGNREGVGLTKAYVRRARELGARHVSINTNTGVDIDRVIGFYERLGFTRVGANLVMEI